MKVLKKFASIIIAVCLMIPVLSTVVFAADGVLCFLIRQRKSGENVSVDFCCSKFRRYDRKCGCYNEL